MTKPTIITSDDSGFTALVVMVSDPEEAKACVAKLLASFEAARKAALDKADIQKGTISLGHKALNERQKKIDLLQAELEDKLSQIRALA
jgi:hypothetical protein